MNVMKLKSKSSALHFRQCTLYFQMYRVKRFSVLHLSLNCARGPYFHLSLTNLVLYCF